MTTNSERSGPKVAIVTGAGSGVGRATATALAADGWTTVLGGRRRQPLEETAAGIRAAGGTATAAVTDVTDETDVRNLFAAAVEAHGRVDLLFNNAGTPMVPSSIEDVSLDEWKRVVDTNLTGAFLCLREAFRVMKDQDPQGGRIVNNGSISAYVPRPNCVGYTSTKHAVTGLTRQAALDGRKHHIACGQIDIGNASTDLTAAMTAGITQANGTTMVEPTMDAADVAKAVVYMADLPLDANVLFMTVMARDMPYVGRG